MSILKTSTISLFINLNKMKNVSQLIDSRQKTEGGFQPLEPVSEMPALVLITENPNNQEYIETNVRGKEDTEEYKDELENITKPIFATHDQVNDFMKRFRKYR